MDQELLNIQSEMVASKVKHYLITMMGITVDEASDEEFYRAFSMTLREEIMINWIANWHTFKKKGLRKLYYLSMEYMPGRLFENNVSNIRATDLVKEVMKILGREFEIILKAEQSKIGFHKRSIFVKFKIRVNCVISNVIILSLLSKKKKIDHILTFYTCMK